MRYPWSEQRDRVMSTTPAEFITCLQTAFPGQVSADGSAVWLERAGVTLRFSYRIQAPRRIGLLQLPQLAIHIEQTAGQPEDGITLLDAVDHATQRGGG